MKILLVESDKKIAKFITRGLENEGFEVEIVHDGEEGFQRAVEGMYALIIFDVMMPKKDGISLVRELRAKKHLIPIMILSAKDSVENIVAGLDAGADDYIKKPFAFAELLARVQALQRRSEQERGAKLYFADLCLDPVTHKVWRSEKEIELTAREYDLLEYMMRNPNTNLTRNMIADTVWEGQFDKFTNIIDVYVNYLRKKLDREADKKLIHTVRGVGYTFAIKK
jgi:DNA-binding response OmpR family regulator